MVKAWEGGGTPVASVPKAWTLNRQWKGLSIFWLGFEFNQLTYRFVGAWKAKTGDLAEPKDRVWREAEYLHGRYVQVGGQQVGGA